MWAGVVQYVSFQWGQKCAQLLSESASRCMHKNRLRSFQVISYKSSRITLQFQNTPVYGLHTILRSHFLFKCNLYLIVMLDCIQYSTTCRLGVCFSIFSFVIFAPLRKGKYKLHFDSTGLSFVYTVICICPVKTWKYIGCHLSSGIWYSPHSHQPTSSFRLTPSVWLKALRHLCSYWDGDNQKHNLGSGSWLLIFRIHLKMIHQEILNLLQYHRCCIEKQIQSDFLNEQVNL